MASNGSATKKRAGSREFIPDESFLSCLESDVVGMKTCSVGIVDSVNVAYRRSVAMNGLACSMAADSGGTRGCLDTVYRPSNRNGIRP